MKNMRSLLFLLLFPGFVSSQTQPKTVTDFYMALPTSFTIVKNLEDSPFRDGFFFDEFYENATTTSKEAMIKHRKSLIKIEDIKNGYMRLQPKSSDGWKKLPCSRKPMGHI